MPGDEKIELVVAGATLGCAALWVLAQIGFWGFVLYLAYRVVMHFIGAK